MEMDPKWLEFLREQFPQGSRIELREMKDPYPVEPGTKGTLEGIDDAGHFLVQWDNGRTLNLVLGEDRFRVLPPELTTLKLYMPLNAQLYERNEYGDLEDAPAELDGRELMAYQDSTLAAIMKERMPEDKERGLMTCYGKDDSVNQKVRSYNFTVEARQGRLWGVAECEITGKLTGEEMAALKEDVSAQASDGLGEGFEQRAIETSNGELYVSLWSSDKGWSIQTEQERFTPELAEGLPEMCFSILPGDVLRSRSALGHPLSYLGHLRFYQTML